MLDTVKAILYVVATVIMGGVIILCPDISGTVAVFYVSILTTYLGLDVWGMIKSTSLMPPGEYKDMKISRYVLCAVCYVVLTILGYVQSVRTDADFKSMYSVFVSAAFILIGLLIGGLEGNKIATGKDNEVEEDAECKQ